jgi:hypothetical protein
MERFGWVFIVAAGVLAASMLSGCAGEIYLGTRRIDQFERTESMKPQPLKCLFVSCGEASGS